jgi:hypothetical protein
VSWAQRAAASILTPHEIRMREERKRPGVGAMDKQSWLKTDDTPRATLPTRPCFRCEARGPCIHRRE